MALIFTAAYELISGELILGGYAEPNESSANLTEASNAAPREKISITMIDVGQGDCLLISAGKEHMIVDTNTTSTYKTVKNVLNERGIDKLKYVVATHPHADHIGSMGCLIEDFTPDIYYYTDCTATTAAYKKAMEAAEKYAGSMEKLTTGDAFSLGGISFTVLSPDEGYKSDNVNNYSAVLLLEYGEFNALLMGDAEKAVERELLKDSLVPDIDLLKVGHHGSYTSSDEGFLKKAAPELALISLAEDNDYGYPHQITLDKLKEIDAEVYRTDLLGTVTVTAGFDGSAEVS